VSSRNRASISAPVMTSRRSRDSATLAIAGSTASAASWSFSSNETLFLMMSRAVRRPLRLTAGAALLGDADALSESDAESSTTSLSPLVSESDVSFDATARAASAALRGARLCSFDVLADDVASAAAAAAAAGAVVVVVVDCCAVDSRLRLPFTLTVNVVNGGSNDAISSDVVAGGAITVDVISSAKPADDASMLRSSTCTLCTTLTLSPPARLLLCDVCESPPFKKRSPNQSSLDVSGDVEKSSLNTEVFSGATRASSLANSEKIYAVSNRQYSATLLISSTHNARQHRTRLHDEHTQQTPAILKRIKMRSNGNENKAVDVVLWQDPRNVAPVPPRSEHFSTQDTKSQQR
jgi:hypothetical protein